MKLSPRQLVAHLFFARRLYRRGLADSLSVGALASRGDQKVVSKQLRDLQK